LNCALNPLYKIYPYAVKIDVDFEIGKKACQSNCHYVMLSTSRIYGENKELKTYDEFSTPNPFDNYGKNKLNTEIKLLSNFSNQITILRGSNIFGYEFGRNSFMGYCMSQLVNEGGITLTFDGSVRRDFLFVEDAVKIIEQVCLKKPVGVFNLSSNYGLETDVFIKSLISGYEYGGKINRNGNEIYRQFILDNSKLEKTLGIKIGPFDFENIIRDLGKKLYEQRS
jgi:nucleoside-diphosphate-sugar epimerase